MHDKDLPQYKIAFISQPEYYRFIYENDLAPFAEVREFRLTHNMVSRDFDDLVAYNADYNIFFRGEFVPNDVLEKLEGTTIELSSEPFPREINNHIEYTRDSLLRYSIFRTIREKSFDYVFHYDAASLEMMKKDGLELSGDFVFPVATDVYKPIDIEKEWDLFFIGRSTQRREDLFGPLKHHYDFLHIAHGIWGPDLVKYICASRIGLNVHAEDEISWEPRLQMMLACGVFVISEPVTPNEYLRPGKDYIEVTCAEEMAEVVSYYLDHEEERRNIAETGCQRVHERLSSKKVFETFLSGISKENFPRFKVGSGSLFWKVYHCIWKFWRTSKSIFKK
jgi:hypothetical protein